VNKTKTHLSQVTINDDFSYPRHNQVWNAVESPPIRESLNVALNAMHP